MKACTKFENLRGIEQQLFLAKLIEATRCDNQLYTEAEKLIEKATQKGIFEKVKFLPNAAEEKTMQRL